MNIKEVEEQFIKKGFFYNDLYSREGSNYTIRVYLSHQSPYRYHIFTDGNGNVIDILKSVPKKVVEIYEL